ncbi:Rv0340 family IniB-related protein [Mycobacterium camsae]|uniref:Rv0340 family IniB-related protein n=1 Tax=Mycobacterium gordonae TaxID=1778 RepID=UPI0019804D3D|nr:Rv0340 family IniB-related protein [Mycobacterium gordonae]
MANSLLDFVISLVRDPEAAARYATNPDQAIADAHLTDVTSVDVNNLIPMVSDSLSMAGATGAVTGMPVADHGNVWASGAATAAFDAFTPHPPVAAMPEHGAISGVGAVINQPAAQLPVEAPAGPPPVGIGNPEPSSLITGGAVPEIAFDHGGFPASDPGIWDHSVVLPDAHPHDAPPDHHGFGVDSLHG